MARAHGPLQILIANSVFLNKLGTELFPDTDGADRLRELILEKNLGSTGAPDPGSARDANFASGPTFPHAAGQR